MAKTTEVIDLNKLLNYFERLRAEIDTIYPEKLTWDNLKDCPFDLGIDHPDWVKAHFPLVLIIYRPKAGKLRQSKHESIMYQNHFNVMTQLVWNASAFGLYQTKNKHKGFKEIVAAIQADESMRTTMFVDREKPKKFKNFLELGQLFDPSDVRVRALCEVLEENYPCDSKGQLRLL